MNIEKERELFESVFGKNGCEYYPEYNAYQNGNDRDEGAINGKWYAWQAAKKQAIPEGFVLVPVDQLNQWGHMANYAEQYGCPECFEARGYAHNLACEINSYFEPVEAQQSNEE